MLDPVRETFLNTYLAIGNQSEAYRVAKPIARKWKAETVHVKASQMMAEDKVQTRLKALQEKTAEKAEITREQIAQMLLATQSKADGAAQFGASVAASMGLAKLLGHIVDKAEHTGKDGAPLVPAINLTISEK